MEQNNLSNEWLLPTAWFTSKWSDYENDLRTLENNVLFALLLRVLDYFANEIEISLK